MSELVFFQVMSMLGADRPTINTRADGVIFHGRSFNGDDDGLFELASELLSISSRKAILLNGGDGDGVDGQPAWPGVSHYKDRLSSTLPIGSRIFTSKPAKHTLEEASAFSEKAQELGWKRAIVIAQPFQLPRIMCSHLHVMRKRKYPMKIHAAAPKSVDWLKVTNASQGEPGLSRFDQIRGEFERLSKYHAQGNLASVEELVEYLVRGRDAI